MLADYGTLAVMKHLIVPKVNGAENSSRWEMVIEVEESTDLGLVVSKLACDQSKPKVLEIQGRQ